MGHTLDFGAKSEARATLFLERSGFVVVERNYYAGKMGEIDIVATKEGVLHFIEVKSASADFDPIYNLTPAKLQKVIRSAYHYMKRHRLDTPFSIDALLVRREEIEFLENITL